MNYQIKLEYTARGYAKVNIEADSEEEAIRLALEQEGAGEERCNEHIRDGSYDLNIEVMDIHSK